MPWSASDYPSSMKNLDAGVRRRAIEIANGILESGGDEGVAIATGIARAEKEFKKSARSPRPTLGQETLKLATGDPIVPSQEKDEGPHAFAGVLTAGSATPADIHDPNDPTLHVPGFAVMRKSQIEKGITERLNDALTQASRKSWGGVRYYLTNGVILAMAKTLEEFEKTGMYYDIPSGTMKKLEPTP